MLAMSIVNRAPVGLHLGIVSLCPRRCHYHDIPLLLSGINPEPFAISKVCQEYLNCPHDMLMMLMKYESHCRYFDVVDDRKWVGYVVS